MQEHFIKELRKVSKGNSSFVDEVASILDIGYDAAYRRVNNKSNLSFEEGVKLARHFNLSLNKLYEVGSKSAILTEIYPSPNNIDELAEWFKNSIQNVNVLTQVPNSKIIWAGKDISIFRSLKSPLIATYKMYVWLKAVNTNMAVSKISFDDWKEKVPDSLLKSALNLGKIYQKINIDEMWNENTISGTLHQIIYYFETNLISENLALAVCDEIHSIINDIENDTIEQTLNNSSDKTNFNLYKSDIQSFTNTLLIVTPNSKIFFTSYTILGYIKIEDPETCEKMYKFLNKQQSISKLLANSGERDRTLFFYKLRKTIDLSKERISNYKYLNSTSL